MGALWDALTGKTQAQGQALDAQLAALNNQDYSPGGRIYEQIAAKDGTDAADKTLTIVQGNLATGATGDVLGQVGGAFQEGWQQGAMNERNAISGFINSTVGNFVRVIPWQIWLIAILAGTVYFWPVIRPFAKRLSKYAQ